jgi:hypothetical protein
LGGRIPGKVSTGSGADRNTQRRPMVEWSTRMPCFAMSSPRFPRQGNIVGTSHAEQDEVILKMTSSEQDRPRLRIGIYAIESRTLPFATVDHDLRSQRSMKNEQTGC